MNLGEHVYAAVRNHGTLVGGSGASLHGLPGTTLSPSCRTEPSGTLSDFLAFTSVRI